MTAESIAKALGATKAGAGWMARWAPVSLSATTELSIAVRTAQ